MVEIIRTVRLSRVGDSFAIFLPMEWIRMNGLKKGDFLEIRADENVTITPK